MIDANADNLVVVDATSQLSRFLSTIPVSSGTTAIVNNLVFDPVFLSNRDAARLFSGEGVDALLEARLRKAGVIAESGSDDLALKRIREYVKAVSGRPSILYLVLTTQCNLSCTYCFIQESPLSVLPQQFMSLETACAAVDFFIDQADDSCNCEFILYGGEPTLRPELFIHVMHYIRNVAPASRISVVTNGTLLDERLVAELARCDVSVGISVDGPKRVNDVHRAFRRRGPSVYDRVERSMEMLRRFEVPFGISLTISESVLESQDEVIAWLKEIGVNPFLNPAHYSSPSKDWEDMYRRMSEFMLRVVTELSDVGIAESRMAGLVGMLAEGFLKFQGCGALGLTQLAVRPNGDVGVCHGDSQSNTGVLWNLGNIPPDPYVGADSYWIDLLAANQPECLRCEAFAVCGGGCPLEAEALFGSREHIDHAMCIFNRSIARFLVAELYRLHRTSESLEGTQGGDNEFQSV